MALEALQWPIYPPTSTDVNDGDTNYVLGVSFGVDADVPCAGVEWRVPDSLITPTGGTHRAVLWRLDPVGGDTLLRNEAIVPVAGTLQQFIWSGGPVTLDDAYDYIVGVYLVKFALSSASGVWNFKDPSNRISALAGRLVSTTNPAVDIPNGSANSYYYVSPLVGESDEEPEYSQVTSTLTAKWRVYSAVTSSLTSKWRVYGWMVSDLTAKWRIFSAITTTLTSKWRILSGVVSSLTSKWRFYDRAPSTFKAKWRIFGEAVPPTASQLYLDSQRRMTQLLIDNDPTTAELIPITRVYTASGGYEDVDGTPRDAQTFKLSLLAYDQRPTITVAGVERIMDYHLIGPWNMAVAVGDHWEDDEGTKYEIAGFTEGWDYMVKAFVFRRVPRGAMP